MSQNTATVKYVAKSERRSERLKISYRFVNRKMLRRGKKNLKFVQDLSNICLYLQKISLLVSFWIETNANIRYETGKTRLFFV